MLKMRKDNKNSSDSDFRLNDEDSDNESSDIAASNINEGLKNGVQVSSQNELLNYKRSAEMWTIEQLTEEISTLTEQRKKLNSEEISEKREISPSKPTFFRPNRQKRRADSHCFCKGRYSLSAPMVQCDGCSVWYHQSCVGLTQAQCDKMETFVCEECKRERLEEIDLRRTPRKKKSAKEIDISENVFERMRELLRGNRAFYYKNRKNFVRLFAEKSSERKYCQKALSYPIEKLEKKIEFYKKEIKNLVFATEKEKKSWEKKLLLLDESAKKISPLKKLKKAKHEMEGKVKDKHKSPKEKEIKKESEEKKPVKKDIKKEPKDNKKTSKNKSINKKLESKNTIEKIKKIMSKYNLSQKSVAKNSGLVGGSTTLSSLLRGKSVFNKKLKIRQLKKWYRKFVLKKRKTKRKIKASLAKDEEDKEAKN